MITKQEQKQIERVFKKPISEIEELSIPTYIRNRENTETLEEEAERIKSEIAYEEDWDELHNAFYNKDGEYMG